MVELVIALGLVTLVTTAMLLVFWSGIVLWDRYQAESAAHWNGTQAARLILAEARQAVRCQQWARGALPAALEVVLPADADAEGNYVPVWDHSKLVYREGPRHIFYLSDASGAYDVGGSMLWRGSIVGTGDPGAGNVAPDRQWSLYYDTGRAQVSGIESAVFEVQADRYWVRATMTATGQQSNRTVSKQASGLAYWANHNG